MSAPFLLELDSIEEAQLLNDLVMYGMVKLVPMKTPTGQEWARAKAAEKEAAVSAVDEDLALRLGEKMHQLLTAVDTERRRRA